VLLMTFALGCESPTDPDDEDSIGVDDFIEHTYTPEPTHAVVSDGKTYRLVRGNNQPDEILAYDWKTSFAITLKANSTANSDDLDLTFPLKISSVTAQVQQAAGGIVSPPTGGDTEHYESLVTSATANSLPDVDVSATLTFDVWYDLPSLRREALITVTFVLQDADGRQFQKMVEVQVAPS